MFLLKSVFAGPLRAVAVAATLAATTSPAMAASALPDYPFIHASGEAYMSVAPNLGEIDFEIAAFNAAPEAAVALVQQRVTEIQQLLAENGVAEGDITFSDLRREMRKGADPSAPEYDIKCSVHIKVRDLTKWRALMEPLIVKPNLDAFATTFGTTERKQVERELVVQAVQDAQDKAATMASGFGKKIGAVTGISSNELKNVTRAVGLVPPDRYYAEGKGKRPPQDRSELLMVQTLRMAKTVDMIFKIKQ